jgi:glycosyltransferase involved in cell wall biosynthesis
MQVTVASEAHPLQPPDEDELSPVAIIEPVGGHAGMNNYDIELCRGLYQAGIRSRLYTCDETLEVSEPGITILKPFRGLYGEGLKPLRGLRFLIGLFAAAYDARRHKVRVAHLHYFQYGVRELACCVTLKLLGIKIVATAHDINSLSSPEGIDLFKTVIRLTEQLIVHNSFSARVLIEKAGASFAMPPISVINIGNFLSSIRLAEQATARQSLFPSSEEPVLLFFGQIKPEKGLAGLLSAFAIHRQRGGTGRLLVAGRPTSHDPVDYQKMADELGIAGYVKFELSYIPEEDTSLFFAAADLVVLPYSEIYQSAVLIMAMSYGRAVLVSDLPAMMEIIRDGVNGLTYKAGDTDSMADTLGRALADRGRLAELGVRAAEDMKENYSWERVGERISKVYSSALQ